MDWARLRATLVRDGIRFTLIFLGFFLLLEGLRGLAGEPFRIERPLVLALCFLAFYGVCVPALTLVFWLLQRNLNRS
jgi:hypothetical protein